MKAPSKDITGSLRGQRIPGRSPETIETSAVKGKPSMTVPARAVSKTSPPRVMSGAPRTMSSR